MMVKGAFTDGILIPKRNFFDFVDRLNDDNKLFMISYVLEHKGKYNFQLKEWIKKNNYNIIEVDPQLVNNRQEILITNYIINANTTLYNKKSFSEAT
ncbi:DUF4411 family protein [Algoriphagus boritolerans]|uniref:DUF4411 family protein n=1 Tax=Algoriphagus boritolerans TaxID=308111 RepID=UPI003A0FF3F7